MSLRMGRATRIIGVALAACAMWLAASGAQAQGQFPQKPIRLVVPQAPGSATDTLARLLALELEPILGQKIVIENKPGAAFTIGLDLVAKSAPDGYTIGMGPVGALAISPNMIAKVPYNIARDFQPIALVSRGHLLLAVSPKSNIRSVKELIAEAKKNPGKLTNASSANGSPGHVGGELFKFMTGTQIVHVPYRGGAAATNDLIAGHVQLMFESLNSIAPHAKSGRVRGLAVSGARRSPAFPELPTVAEAGVPGYDAPTWSGVVGPAGIPRDVVMKLNAAINRAITTPAFIERFGKIGDEPAGGPPEEFAETIAKESAKWADVIKRSGAKLN
ncbi:MAG: Bug family tripartite tricarboxylate transporter substrate binding protein [Xanthobacteraceae bacterium]